MHRNTLRFPGQDPVQEITLVAMGTMWPRSVEIDGETWEQGELVAEECDATRSVRLYRYVQPRSVS